MKVIKAFIILIAINLPGLNVKSQYIPILKEGNQWNIHRDWANPVNYTEIYKIGGDTLISNETWEKVVYTKDSSANAAYNLRFYLKEDTNNKKIFALLPGQIPKLYFDFNANIYDTLLLYNPYYNIIDTFVVTQITSEIYGGILHRKFTINHPNWVNEEIWIEGIGSLHGIFYGNNPAYTGNQFTLLCFSRFSQQIYPAINTNTCYLSNIGIIETAISDTNIFPNPAKEFIYIANLPEDLQIEIYTIDGKLQRTFIAKENTKVDVSDFSTGLYLLKILTKKGIAVKKFIKQ